MSQGKKIVVFVSAEHVQFLAPLVTGDETPAQWIFSCMMESHASMINREIEDVQQVGMGSISMVVPANLPEAICRLVALGLGAEYGFPVEADGDWLVFELNPDP